MKKLLFLVALMAVLVTGVSVAPSATQAKDLGASLKGRILLAVQANGEAWYINPANMQRYFLGRPYDAFNLMQNLGLGISNASFNSLNGKAPANLSGKFLLKVEDSGKAYYVNPTNLKLYYLGNPEDAFSVMRELGLGITNVDLSSIKSFSAGNIPTIEVDKQSTRYDNVIIRTVVARAKGWIVIYNLINGEPGDVVGQSAVSVGENHNVYVRLSGINNSQDLVAMLHYDLGQQGAFEYNGPDVPVILDGKIVMNRFFTTYYVSADRNIQIIGSSFSPTNITIKRGTTVIWTNQENIYHTITSPNNFDSGRIAPGKTYSRMFNDAGIFNYDCSLHSNMTGTITVIE